MLYNIHLTQFYKKRLVFEHCATSTFFHYVAYYIGYQHLGYSTSTRRAHYYFFQKSISPIALWYVYIIHQIFSRGIWTARTFWHTHFRHHATIVIHISWTPNIIHTTLDWAELRTGITIFAHWA